MIKIENAVFVVIQDLNDIVLKNLTNDYLPFALDFQNKNNPDFYEEVFIETVLPLGFVTLPITKEGRYRIRIGTAVVYFSKYFTLTKEVVKGVRRALCDCGCTDCSRCEDKEGNIAKRNQSLYALLNGYTNLIKPFSSALPERYNKVLFNFYQTIFTRHNISIQCTIAKQILETQISGNPSTNQELTNYNTAVFYLGVYFYYKYSIINAYPDLIERETQLRYLDQLFNYNIIQNCISKLGICIKEYEEIYIEIINEVVDVIPDPEPEPVLRPFIVSIIPYNTIIQSVGELLTLTCITDAIGEGTSIVNYTWEIISNSEGEESEALIYNSLEEVNQAILEGGAENGIYGIKVTATNDFGQIAIANTLITYQREIKPSTFAINAGEDKVLYPTGFTNLDSTILGLGGGIEVISYLWELVSTVPPTEVFLPVITNPTNPDTALTGLDALTTYTYKVTAINNIGEIAFDSLTIFVYPYEKGLEYDLFVNPDRTITTSFTYLKSYTEVPEDQEIVSRLWRVASSIPDVGIDLPIIENPTSEVSKVTNLKPDTIYTFDITVENNLLEGKTKTLTITVL